MTASVVVERSLYRARWAGAVLAVLQAFLLRPEEFQRPYVVPHATAALGLILALANVALAPSLRRRSVGARMGTLQFVLDSMVIYAVVWLYLDSQVSVSWALFILIPIEAAYRWRLKASVAAAATTALYYAAVRYASGAQFGFPVATTDVTFVTGLLLVEAFAVGGVTQRLREERDALQALHESAFALSARLDARSILATVAREAARLAHAGFAVVWVAEHEAFVPAGSHGLPSDVIGSVRLPQRDATLGEAGAFESYRTQAPSMRSGFGPADSPLEAMVLPRPVGAQLCVPIRHEQSTIGVLSCYFEEPHRFDPDEVARIESLASLAAIAITNATAYERERSAAEALREADQIKEDFLSTISHELRTPLTAVEGFATTLLRRWESLPEQARRDFVSRIQRQSRSLHSLIGTLLDFAQLQAGRYAFRPQLLDVKERVQRTLQHASPTLDPHPVTVDVPSGLWCTADAFAFDRIMENLLVNAARYSPPDAPITVGGRRDGDWIEISVSDRGHGIPAADRDRVFERFWRGSGEEVQKVRGTGVGLAVVKDLVTSHGGVVWVEVAVGGGSRFVFRLPESKDPAEPVPDGAVIGGGDVPAVRHGEADKEEESGAPHHGSDLRVAEPGAFSSDHEPPPEPDG